MNVENHLGETDPTNVDPIAFIEAWPSNSMPSKAYEFGHNRPFTHFDEVVAKFQRLDFDPNLKDSLSNPN